MANPKLITWTLNVTHLSFDEETTLLNSVVIPKGILCGRKPRKGGFGKFGDAIIIPFGSPHLRFGRMSFCKDCTTKLAELFETQQAIQRKVTRHPLELLTDGMLDGSMAR